MRKTHRGHVDQGRRARAADLALDPRTVTSSEKGEYFADLYSGTGGVGRAAQRRFGVFARFFDIKYGQHCNLTCMRVIRSLIADVRTGFFVAAMIAITCTSWSTVRNRTNTLRSKLEPWGLLKPRKPFSLKDNQRLLEGNLQARRLFALLKY